MRAPSRPSSGPLASLSAYDATDAALAVALECPLLSTDRRLAKAASPTVQVRVID